MCRPFEVIGKALQCARHSWALTLPLASLHCRDLLEQWASEWQAPYLACSDQLPVPTAYIGPLVGLAACIHACLFGQSRTQHYGTSRSHTRRRCNRQPRQLQ